LKISFGAVSSTHISPNAAITNPVIVYIIY